MKYIILIGDGMADWPLRELGGRTCLQAAWTPNMDKIASEGIAGRVRTIPPGFPPGSDVANLSIFGYNPLKYYSGRAPLEAAAMGLKLGRNDVAYRCNLVTLKFPSPSLSKGEWSEAVMDDYSAGHITTKEAALLIKKINSVIGGGEFIFYPGVSYRHLMIWKGGKDKAQCTPPHDIIGKKISNYLPHGSGSSVLRDLMQKSKDVLLEHPVNKKRIKAGLKPANSIWLWGQGKMPAVPEFKDKYGLKGALVSAVDLTKGLGISAGFEIIKVRGATGYLDTNYSGKARAALNALKKVDIVYLHVEAPDEAGHNGDMKSKIRAIEDFDSKVVGTVLRGLRKFKDYRILLLPDHATPVKVRTHTDEPVPFAVYDSRIKMKNKGASFNESIAKKKKIMTFDKGYKLMDYFIYAKSVS